MLHVIPQQSYLVKKMEGRMAAAIGALMFDLGANVTGANLSQPWRDPFKTCYYPVGWRIDNQHYDYRRHSHGVLCKMWFRNARWDQSASDLNYGPKTVDSKIDERDTGKTKIIRNDTDGVLHVAYSESVELTNSFSSSITKGVTLDVTESAELASEQKVSGSYAGVSAEVSVSEKFGISRDKSKSTEEGKEESKEGTTNESLAIDFDAAPHTYYLVEIKKEAEQTSQPYDINGIMNFDIELHFNNVIGGNQAHFRPHDKVITLVGIDGLEQFVQGYDTRYPSMEGYWSKAAGWAKHAIEWIDDPENRRIQASGISHANLQSNADYDVETLGKSVPDELAHLPVVNAQDV